jgi:signal transduction histidine kinase
LPTLKLKMSVIILAAIAVSVGAFFVGIHLDLWPSVAGVTAGALALVVVFFLSRGLTSPLREMVEATEAMARGDFSRHVTETSRSDEIGTLARAFNAMADELAETDRVRRDLIANVSHELRTPITALQAVLENVVDGIEPLDDEKLHTMLAQVERLGRLVQRLLDLSRLESGAVPLERRSFAVEPMLEHAVRETRLHAGDISFRVAVEPRGLRLEADDERLHQVIANLVENAVRASPTGGVVEVVAAADPHGVRFEVRDQGPGIPGNDATRVFERFYRADTARSSDQGGAGLGLAIARWIVDLHDGDIHVEKNQPNGCRMVVTIPGRVVVDEDVTPNEPDPELVIPVPVEEGR